MSKSYLSIDIGGTYTKYAQIDAAGTIKTVFKEKTPSNRVELEQTLEAIVAPISKHVRGVGVSCPGKVDIHTGTVYHGGALPFLHGYSFRDYFEQQFQLPCGVINDGKAAALAEVWLGNLKSISNGVAIVLGTGVGGGIIANGDLLQGSHFQAGEFSFLFRSPQLGSPDNTIGFTGSAVKFVEKCANQLGLLPEDGIGVFQVLEKGENPVVQDLFQSYCREIGFIILNLQAILDCEKIVIGGGISQQPLLIEEINRQYLEMRQNFSFWDESWESIQIENCQFHNNANLLGAVYQLLLQLNHEC